MSTVVEQHPQHWRLLVALVAAVLAVVVGIGVGVDAHASSPTVEVAGTRVAAHDVLDGPVVAAYEAIAAGEGRRTTTGALDVAIGSRVAPRGALDDLQAAANRASANVGPGRGAVHGTHVHSSFADELAALGRTDVFSEISYLNGRVVPYGTKGSVRLDAVVGSPGAPTAIYDLKTGSAALTPSRIAQIRSHLPPGFQNIPVHELRPG